MLRTAHTDENLSAKGAYVLIEPRAPRHVTLIGTGSELSLAVEAAKAAISSPLLEASVEGAMGILLNITGGSDLGLFEVNEAAEIISSAADCATSSSAPSSTRTSPTRCA
jgi:hypothetical protein